MSAATSGGIDCDLHPAVPGIATLLPYLDPHWADAVAQRGVHDLEPTSYPLRAPLTSRPDWRVAGAGPGLEDRRVEITGPTDRKMTINAMNSGAKVWLADHEDATSPTWANVIGG